MSFQTFSKVTILWSLCQRCSGRHVGAQHDKIVGIESWWGGYVVLKGGFIHIYKLESHG